MRFVQCCPRSWEAVGLTCYHEYFSFRHGANSLKKSTPDSRLRLDQSEFRPMHGRDLFSCTRQPNERQKKRDLCQQGKQHEITHVKEKVLIKSLIWGWFEFARIASWTRCCSASSCCSLQQLRKMFTEKSRQALLSGEAKVWGSIKLEAGCLLAYCC